MLQAVVTPRSLTVYPHEWYEEKSYDFMQYYLFAKEWYCYSSKFLSKELVLQLADLYCLTHGRIFHPDSSFLDFWSVKPINIFRYKFLSDATFSKIKYHNPSYNQPGYIVEGAYWSNGWFYQIVNENTNIDNYVDNLVEINLFIDKKTFQVQNYPENYSTLSDIMSLNNFIKPL